MNTFDHFSKEGWLLVCAGRFKYYGCDDEQAAYMAELCLDSVDGDVTYDPVDCADEEVSYWVD